MTLLVALLALTLAGCRSQPDSPEAQIRAWVEHAEQAAEAKEAWAVEDLVSERYQDADGLDRRALMAIMLRQFLQHRSIHIFTRIRSIEIEGGEGRAVVFAAMAGQPIPSRAELAAVRADIYRFEIELSEESPREWKLTRAAWRPAELEDVE